MDPQQQDDMQADIEELYERLHAAFGSEDGSFLQRLRNEMVWDNEAFTQLVQDMRGVCELKTDEEFIERWLADGFWYIPHFVSTWITHPDFPKERLTGSHALSKQLLEDLAHWFFTDDCPWEDPEGWIAMAVKDSATTPVPRPQPAGDSSGSEGDGGGPEAPTESEA